MTTHDLSLKSEGDRLTTISCAKLERLSVIILVVAAVTAAFAAFFSLYDAPINIERASLFSGSF